MFFTPTLQIQPELISLDPGKIGEVDHATYQQRLEDKEALYVRPILMPFFFLVWSTQIFDIMVALMGVMNYSHLTFDLTHLVLV